jgi:1-acyl-sn-glycerol-3-phosphate acyltransferase
MAGSRIGLYLRNAAFYLAAGAWSAPFLVLTPFLWLPFPLVWRAAALYLRGILFLLGWLCGLGYEVRGRERVPPGPVLYASAHQSSWESLFFHLVLDNPAIVAKGESFGYPVVGNIVRRNRHIRTNRDGDPEELRAAMLDARRQVANGRSILIYPSGTRTGRATDVPMRRGVVALYETLGVPCVPIAHNSGLFWPNDSWLRYPGTVVVELGEPIAPGRGKEAFLALLGDRVHDAACRLLSLPAGMALHDEPRAARGGGEAPGVS